MVVVVDFLVNVDAPLGEFVWLSCDVLCSEPSGELVRELEVAFDPLESLS